MYKLTKGIKKKVKGKKKPTEEELEQEELRQYRLEKQREREQKEQEQREQAQTEESGEDQEETEAADPNAESSQRQEKSAPESDEWAKFRALTSGVDSVLSTTKESLQTIKETSYFIRKKAAKDPEEGKRDEKPAVAVASKPKWVDVDAGEEEEEAEEPAAEPVTAPVEEPPRSPTPEKVDLELVLSEVEKLERAQYFEEDVFNTEYVDAVTSGDINFAVIPDSPTEEGDDPFDTSVVDQVLRETPEQQKRSKLKAIKLGKAVQLLSGAQEDAEKPEEAEAPAEAVPKKSRRRERGVYKRPGSLDLLDSSEASAPPENQNNLAEGVCQEPKETPAKTLLDEDICDGGEFELNLAVTPEFRSAQVSSPGDEVSAQGSPNKQISSIVSEFETVSEVPSAGSNEAILTAQPPDEDDCAFDSLANESLLRAKDREELIGDDDPFDTSAAKQILGEDKVTEVAADFDEDDVKFEADFGECKPKPSRPPPPVIITSPKKEQPDLLTSNEHHDYEPLPEPINFCRKAESKPEALDEEEEEVDPFDTSAAGKLCGTEIKLLEDELLSSSEVLPPAQVPAPFEADDFDPRAGEEKPEPDPFDTSFAGGFVAQPIVDAEQLLASTPTQDSTPVCIPPQQSQDAANEPEVDPFDTSIADTFGNVELKVLESELLSNASPAVPVNLEGRLDLSATSAPPRPPPPALQVKASFAVSFDEEREQTPALPELLTLTPVEEDVAPVALVPQRTDDECPEEEQDPFDTSIADKFGAVEVNVLEKELLGATAAPVAKQLTDLLPTLANKPTAATTDTSASVVSAANETIEEIDQEQDVFDTSHVEALGIASSCETDGGRVTKPRSLQVSESSAALLATTPEDPNPLLQPSAPGPHSQLPADEDFDPFDTSAADQFGHTELRVLESELIGEVSCTKQPPRPPPPVLRAPFAPSAERLPTLQPSADAPPPPVQLSPVTLDPFDTSIAERYGTTELRVLEREFAAADASPTSVLKRSVSDPDFDPRGDEKVARPETPQLGVNLLDSQLGGGHLVPVLAASAVSETADEAELADPFDTSIADSLLPGQAELQVLERELLQS
ncbi:protein stoned-A-like [Pollicipes pollicipes]|uniref:protein stoned-A-like n=1 Tax=Pollicipes pollicipes TaxID=41117 RepID=UPI001884E12D|nr:protein stoned-A-like [Pollicipes pollicipes]